MVDLLAKKSGLGSSMMSSLIKLAAPFLLGKIGSILKGKGVPALMSLLSGQKEHVKASMPSGLGNILGLSSLGKFGDIASDTLGSTINKGRGALKETTDFGKDVGTAAVGTAKSGLGFLKWLLPLVLLAAALYFIVGKGCGKSVDKLTDATTSVVDGAGDMANNAADAASNTAAKLNDAVIGLARSAFATIDEAGKAALDKISFATNSAGNQMVDFINGDSDNPVFTFRNLTFATGSAGIDNSSMSEVDNIAAVLRAYPKVNIAIQGYTDNTGNPGMNKNLSQARAESVKARLIAQGTTADRMVAEGFGINNPVADNSTEEGRSQNRRIEIKVITE
jgi:outer membrane protein OmpA-like peptidoglycan-associated protein